MIGLVQEVSPVNEIESGKSDGEDDAGVEVGNARTQHLEMSEMLEIREIRTFKSLSLKEGRKSGGGGREFLL